MRKPAFWTDNNGNLFDSAPDIEIEEYEKYGIIPLYTKADLEDAYNKGVTYNRDLINFKEYFENNYQI